MKNVLISAAFVAFGFALAACTPAQVAQTDTAVTTACALAPVLDASTGAVVQADVARGCADVQVLAPVVAPMIPAPAAK